MYIHIYIHTHTHTHTHVYVYVYIYIYTYMYIHTHYLHCICTRTASCVTILPRLSRWIMDDAQKLREALHLAAVLAVNYEPIGVHRNPGSTPSSRRACQKASETSSPVLGLCDMTCLKGNPEEGWHMVGTSLDGEKLHI